MRRPLFFDKEMKRASMGVLKIIIPDLDRIWHHAHCLRKNVTLKSDVGSKEMLP